ncbi:hypothetical protein BI364_14285 [Acidihalobacter yilgarnensis]|uniref:DUF502 domain-containing protein n=1 Tax=Acidihalobacter yilgarnensis TaxID=2819280 RepID=A0A1D8IRE5_9GAMM|nr:DUF502 domain-containing protein [Acidihalobacter yilgarnensis]AOU98965.1 hypothetical protein BI364_14285 [Acidihalobacter yilgarnensis]
MATWLRRYLIAGLLIWVPLVITVTVIDVLMGFMDRTLLLLPLQWRPEALLGYPIPGLGFVMTVAIVLLTGLLAANLFGRKVVAAWEALLARIPLVRGIYSAVKQVAETLFAANGEAFRKVLLIEYPRRGIWTLAFQTGNASREIQERTAAEVITVFVPTTPNPTSGFIMMLPREEVIELSMTVEEALKLIVSLGVVAPREIPTSTVVPEV